MGVKTFALPPVQVGKKEKKKILVAMIEQFM